MAMRPKRETKILNRYSEAFVEPKVKKPRISWKNDNKLYDVEIVDTNKEEGKIKIHFKGYSDKYDEWRSCVGEDMPIARLERRSVLSRDSLVDRLTSFHESLYREVKRKLYSRHRDDPEVRIDLPIDEDVFEEGMKTIKNTTTKMSRGKTIYSVRSNRDLDELLGAKWDERIFNQYGDFAYVFHGTVRFWCSKKTRVTEYKLIGGRYVESVIEDGNILIFTFVRGDGNSHNYNNR